MAKATTEKLTLRRLADEVDSLRKRIFIYETLQAEKEAAGDRRRGPFKNGKDMMKKLRV